MADLKPCPFCGGKARIREYACGHKNDGMFTASYSCGCENCRIDFSCNSEFHLVNGEPVFKINGYQTVVEKWNTRYGEQNNEQNY
jgi:hypothetical protein